MSSPSRASCATASLPSPTASARSPTERSWRSSSATPLHQGQNPKRRHRLDRRIGHRQPGLGDQFDALRQQHAKDPVVASATATRRRLPAHLPRPRHRPLLSPRRRRFNEPAEARHRAEARLSRSCRGRRTQSPAAGEAPATSPLCRIGGSSADPHGQIGWVYSRLVEFHVPEAIARYAEGQRIIGAYVLQTVDDPDAHSRHRPARITTGRHGLTRPSSARNQHSGVRHRREFLKHGLPYDFDQIRVFNWNLKKHRYETSFREHNIDGLSPRKALQIQRPLRKDPRRRAAAANLQLHRPRWRRSNTDPRPKDRRDQARKAVTKTYRLEGNICRRILPPNTPAPEEAHPVPGIEKRKGQAQTLV